MGHVAAARRRGKVGVLVMDIRAPEFAALDPGALAAVMRGRVVVDARNLLDREAVAAAGLDYRGLGR
jgi:UDPglucose 6-dehydrogenase